MDEKSIYKSPIGRFSWVFVTGDGDPKAEEGKPAFKATIMLPKNLAAMEGLNISKERKQAILAEVQAFLLPFKKACAAKAKGKWGDKWKSTRWDPILDGDVKADELEKAEYNKGFWLLRTKTKFKPDVYKPVLKGLSGKERFIGDNDDPQTGIYSGAWGRINLSLYDYLYMGKKGIGVGLGSMQKAYNDEVLGGTGPDSGFSTDDDIEDVEPDEGDLDGTLDIEDEDEELF